MKENKTATTVLHINFMSNISEANKFVQARQQAAGNENRLAVNWLTELLPTPEDQRDYGRERCRIALAEAIGQGIEDSGLSRTEIAEKLGVTKGYVSQVLSGKRNMTIKTLADLLWVSDRELVDVSTQPLGVIMTTPESALEWTSARIVDWTLASTLTSRPLVVDFSRNVDPAINNNLALAA